MIDYSPFWTTLKNSRETTYTLINKHRISSATIDKLRKNKPMTTTTICKSQYKNAQKSEYKNVQGSDIYSSGCASKNDRFSLRRYDGPLIETISE